MNVSSSARAQPLLQAALTFLHPRLAIGAQLLGLCLLLGREHREQVAAEPRLLHRQIRFHGCEVLHRIANAPLVNRERVDGLLPCGVRRPEPLHQRARLLPVLLGDVPRLFTLRLGEIQRREWKSWTWAAGTTRTTSAGTARALRKRRGTRDQKHECGKDDVSE